MQTIRALNEFLQKIRRFIEGSEIASLLLFFTLSACLLDSMITTSIWHNQDYKNRFFSLLLLLFLPLLKVKSFSWKEVSLTAKLIVLSSLFLVVWPLVSQWYLLTGSRGSILPYALSLLSVLCFRHPALLGPVSLLVVYGNLHYHLPLNMAGLADRRLPLGILFMAALYSSLRSLIKPKPSVLTSGVLILIASYYLSCGLAKSPVDWLSHNSITNIVFSARSHGWRLPWDGLWQLLIDYRSVLDKAMATFTLLVEVGILAICFGGPIAAGFLACAFLLHLGIFLTTGIFFWKWMILLLAACIGLLLDRSKGATTLQNMKLVGLTSLLILLGQRFLSPPGLGWYDSRLNHIYTLTGNLKDGRKIIFPPHYFSPHEVGFAQKNFRFLDKGKTLAGTYGVITDLNVYLKLQNISKASKEEIFQIIEAHGEVKFDEKRRKKFIQLLSQLLKRRTRKADLLGRTLPESPRHIFENTPELVDTRFGKLIQFVVRKETVFHDLSGEPVLIEDHIVDEFEIKL